MRNLSTEQKPTQESHPGIPNPSTSNSSPLRSNSNGPDHPTTPKQWLRRNPHHRRPRLHKSSTIPPMQNDNHRSRNRHVILRQRLQMVRTPKRIISDRDPRFTSSFATELVKAIQATRNLSTAYHPQTDGLTERKNQWIEQYLRLFAANTQDDWDKWLTIATVVHNSWPNATTKVAPSQAMLGYLPDLTGTKIQTTNETISQRQEQAEQWRTKAKEALNQAANQIPAEQYSVGDNVWLENKNLTLTHGTRKLHPRRHGPFEITKQISPVAYKLNSRSLGQSTTSSTHHSYDHIRRRNKKAPTTRGRHRTSYKGNRNTKWRPLSIIATR
jgi:hypothetical protein